MIAAILRILEQWFPSLFSAKSRDSLQSASAPQDSEAAERPSESLAETVAQPPATGAVAQPPATGTVAEARTGAGAADPVQLPPATAVDDRLVREAWERWRARAEAWLGGPRPAPQSAYEDILLAALGLGPGKGFRNDFSKMRLSDWNALAISSLPFPGHSKRKSTAPEALAPGWVLPLALHGLGFNANAIRAGADLAGADRSISERLVRAANPSGAGILVVEHEPNLVDLSARAALRAVLVVPTATLASRAETIAVLAKAEAFTMVVTEDASDYSGPYDGLPPLPFVAVRRRSEPYKPEELALMKALDPR